MLNRLLASGATCTLAVLLVACSSTAATPLPTPSSGGGGAAATAAASSPAPGTSSGTGGGGGTGQVPDPCTLLTQQQVAGVVGLAVAAGAPSGSHACAFTYTDSANILNSLTVTVSDNVAATQVAKDCQAPSGNGLTITAVGGVGDVACYVEAGILGSHITFAASGQGFEVSIVSFGSLQSTFPIGTAEPMEKALALDVVAKV